MQKRKLGNSSLEVSVPGEADGPCVNGEVLDDRYPAAPQARAGR